MKTIRILIFFSFILSSSGIFAQHGRGHGHGRRHERVVVRSVYRPATIGVYHPAWHPHYDYHRRWVYFPRHRVYWDNWRNHYVYYENNVWVSRPAPPAVLINIDLSKEKHREIDDDDNDEIYNR